ncbi:polysaccharide biosynthesis C-terminal domain-containing protein [Rosenbergiella epipactidis]|uniref:oligosaccharide flippase family protein n=1 Tax=Rosenbergiella epipactidis TaxID=1544694 RepID=UPI002026B5C1|nr:polysaccharide biosynthesis C-terminal domain-containing protein [Rosenbergiella epipactidis]MCL9667435.1 polysaccharide biosynthesis C-terminal domain-containing protein [Rosenbergiella epipactidis]
MIGYLLNNNKAVNALWMMSEKFISLFGLIFVTSYVAKYIGPENFGRLTYATTIFGLVRVIAMLGLDDIFFQKISSNQLLGEKILQSSKSIRDFIFIIFSILFLVYFYFVTDYLTFYFSIAACLAVFFSTKDVYSIYFDALLMSKFNTVCNVIGLCMSMLIRYLIVYFSLPLEFFFLSIVSSSLIPYFIRSIIFSKKKLLRYKLNKNNESKYRRYIFLVSKQMLFYALSVQIVIRVSAFFLGSKSNYDLGIYSIASTLSYGYFFMLSAVITSFVGNIYNGVSLGEKRKVYSQILFIQFILFLSFFIFIDFLGANIIKILYGKEFSDAVNILPLLTVACFFSGINTLNEKYMIGFHGYSYLKKKKLILTLFTISVNCILVNWYGYTGAAYATLITEFISMTLFSYFFKSRELLKAQFYFLLYLKKKWRGN